MIIFKKFMNRQLVRKLTQFLLKCKIAVSCMRQMSLQMSLRIDLQKLSNYRPYVVCKNFFVELACTAVHYQHK